MAAPVLPISTLSMIAFSPANPNPLPACLVAEPLHLVTAPFLRMQTCHECISTQQCKVHPSQAWGNMVVTMLREWVNGGQISLTSLPMASHRVAVWYQHTIQTSVTSSVQNLIS